MSTPNQHQLPCTEGLKGGGAITRTVLAPRVFLSNVRYATSGTIGTLGNCKFGLAKLLGEKELSQLANVAKAVDVDCSVGRRSEGDDNEAQHVDDPCSRC